MIDLMKTNAIYIGEARKVLHSFPNESFACCVTSPPYNVGKDYGAGYNDSRPITEYLNDLTLDFAALYPKMKERSLLWLNIGDNAKEPLKSLRVAQAVVNAGFHLIQEIVWIKSITLPVDGVLRTVGHYTPVSANTRFHSCHESIFLFSKRPKTLIDRLQIGVPYEDKSNVGRYADIDLKAPGDCWFVPYDTTGATIKKGHPAPFPRELPRRAIAVSPPGIVVDPYSGYGTTGIAATDEGREFVLIERNVNFAVAGITHHKLSASILPEHLAVRSQL